MVSLRRRKHTVVIEAGQRRSARLLALEEQKHEKVVHAVASMDVLQPSTDAQTSARKRGRKKRVREVYEEEPPQVAGPSNDGNSSSSPCAIQKQTDRIVEYILDMLELKDTKELFSMPDEFQTTDYSEKVSKPGDFATLRQKHKDGMYVTLEQFESDVYIVFNKAITSNSQDSIPYREAMCLHEHAKQVFQSLRNNRTYSELELSAWHQKYFPNKKRAARNDRNTPNSVSALQPQCSSHAGSHADTKQGDSATNTAANGRKQTLNYNRGIMIFPQSKSSSRSYSRKDFADCSKSSTEQRRNTYKVGSYPSEPIVSMAFEQPKQLAYNKNAPSYKNSLLQYLSNAGPEAKMAAKLKYLDYSKRVKMQSVPTPCGQYNPYGNIRLHNLHATKYFGNSCIASSSNNGRGFTSSSGMELSPHGYDDDDDEVLKGPLCELETDELLRLFSLIGTPEFLERSKGILSRSSKQATNNNGSFTLPLNVGVPHRTAVTRPSNGGLRVMARTRQSSEQQQPKCTSIYDLSFWQSRLGELKPSGEKRLAFPEAHPRLAQGGSSSGTMGFSQYAYSGNPFKRSTLNLFCSRKKN